MTDRPPARTSPFHRPSGGRRAARALYLIGANTLLLALLCEFGARALVDLRAEERGAPAVRFPTEDYHPLLRTTNPPGPGVSTHPEFYGWRILPPDADPARADALRILFLGGSTTANRYPEFTVELLRANGVETIGFNAGAPMHTSLQSLYKLWTYADWVRPDLIVVLHNINDLAHGFTAPAHSLPEYRPDYSHASLGQHLVWSVVPSRYDGRAVFGARPRPEFAELLEPRPRGLAAWAPALAEHSTLLWLLAGGGQGLEPEGPTHSAPMPVELTQRSLPAFRRNLLNIRRSARALGVPVVFATMPITVEGGERIFVTRSQVMTNDGRTYLTGEDFLAATDAFNDAIRELAGEGSYVIDFAAEIEDPQLFLDECHLGTQGLRREAQLLVGFLHGRGLLGAR
jgi:hypothetical protein